MSVAQECHMNFACCFKYLAYDVLVLSARHMHNAYSISKTNANFWVRKSHLYFSGSDTDVPSLLPLFETVHENHS